MLYHSFDSFSHSFGEPGPLSLWTSLSLKVHKSSHRLLKNTFCLCSVVNLRTPTEHDGKDCAG